ncbi:oligosaccharide flippase family protein, partial [Clostridium tarantellae]
MKLIKKFLEFAIGNIVVLILGLVSSPLITRLINPIEMGKIGIINTLVNLLILIALIGLDQAYIRYYYDELKENRTQLLKICIKTPFIISMILSIFIIIFYKLISNYIIG